MDAFGKPGTFSEVFKKLLESYTLDAIDWYDPDKEHKALKSEVTKFQKSALRLRPVQKPAHPWAWVPTSGWNPGK